MGAKAGAPPQGTLSVRLASEGSKTSCPRHPRPRFHGNKLTRCVCHDYMSSSRPSPQDRPRLHPSPQLLAGMGRGSAVGRGQRGR